MSRLFSVLMWTTTIPIGLVGLVLLIRAELRYRRPGLAVDHSSAEQADHSSTVGHLLPEEQVDPTLDRPRHGEARQSYFLSPDGERCGETSFVYCEVHGWVER